MRRLFWFGLGAAGAIYAARWVRQKRRQLSPAAVGANLGEVAADLGRLVRAAADEAARAAAEKEAELRASLRTAGSAPSPG